MTTDTKELYIKQLLTNFTAGANHGTNMIWSRLSEKKQQRLMGELYDLLEVGDLDMLRMIYTTNNRKFDHCQEEWRLVSACAMWMFVEGKVDVFFLLGLFNVSWRLNGDYVKEHFLTYRRFDYQPTEIMMDYLRVSVDTVPMHFRERYGLSHDFA